MVAIYLIAANAYVARAAAEFIVNGWASSRDGVYDNSASARYVSGPTARPPWWCLWAATRVLLPGFRWRRTSRLASWRGGMDIS
jgi:hypothetical protein